MFGRIGVVAGKEIIDNIRDRRSVTFALVYPLMGPILIALLLTMISGTLVAKVQRQEPVAVAVKGLEHAPDLARFLQDQGITVRTVDDPLRAMSSQRAQAVVSIPPDFAADFAAGRSANVRMIVDRSKLGGMVAAGEISDLLRGFGQKVAAERLRARGVDPALSQPLRIEQHDLSGGGQIPDLFLAMVPPFIVFTVFIGGVYLAIDTTSGERERGSLEPLLTNPVARWELMMGKYTAALTFTIVALLVQLLALYFAFRTQSAMTYGLHLRVTPVVLGQIFLLAVPMMLVATAIQIIIAALTRSFKEAQTYLGLLPLLPAMAGLALIFAPVKPGTGLMLIPIFSKTLLIGRVLRGDTIDPVHLTVATVVMVLCTVVLTWICARLYSRESLLFGG